MMMTTTMMTTMMTMMMTMMTTFVPLLLLPSVTEQGIGKVMMPDALAIKPLALQGNPNANCAESSSVGIQCPEGFSLHQDSEGAICLWVSSDQASFREANATCTAKGSNLVAIRSQARQETIQNYLSGVDDAVWTGGYKPEGRHSYVWGYSENITYTPWEDGFGYMASRGVERCLKLGNNVNRTWQITDYCDDIYRFLCDVTPGCKPDRFGPDCSNECHCFGEHCQGGLPCGGGCQAGWTGPHCCHRKEPADVAYYCKQKESSQSLELHIDPKTTSYEALQPVNASGLPERWCDNIMVSRDKDSVYTLRVSVQENSGESPCGREKLGNNSYRWRLSLQEKKGLRFPFDKTFIITCDFDDAETMSRGVQYTIESNESRQLGNAQNYIQKLEPTQEDIVLEVVDPDTGDVIHKAALGTYVMLRMRLTVAGKVTAQGVSPYKCAARSLQGIAVRPLTNNMGCPLVPAVISSFRGSNGTLTTDPFPLFSLPSQDAVTITCLVHFCFSGSEQEFCDDRCALYSGDFDRKKRSPEEKPHSVSAQLQILPAQAPQSDKASSTGN